MSLSSTDHLLTPQPALQQAIATVYEVFSGYPAPQTMLNVCTGCCMAPALEREMRLRPLRRLMAQHFYAYNEGAKVREQPTPEIQYLIPRLLELMTQGQHLHHSTELYLQRLGNCEATSFSSKERAAIDAYALAFFAEGLLQSPWERHGRFMGEEAFGILLMFHIGGIDIRPLLTLWLSCDDPMSTLHYTYVSYWRFYPCAKVSNAFASERAGFCELIKQWMLDPSNRQQFAQRLLALEPDAISGLGHPSDTCCAKDMVASALYFACL